MDALNRLRLHIMQDEIQERWNSFHHRLRSIFTRHHRNKIGVSLAETSHESEGRVWVEVGSEGLRLRVTHLHPANPSVSEALRRKCLDRREAHRQGKDGSVLTGKLIYPPEDDKISLSSLEDYWFNHWQGPYISADNNQNSYSLPKLRRSHRKSKRSNRCSICQKKLIRTEHEDNSENACHEREENVVAHMPSIKLDTRVLKDELDERSDDEASKTSVSDDALSRCSGNDEQHTRMHRIVDNELRTSYSLFVEEAVSQDVLDGTVSMDTDDKITDPVGNSRSSLRSPTLSPRQSQSCPCSPKLSNRTYSPESALSNSPKSRSFVGLSKFSLSSSLLAIHRQASSSLVPEFLKFDSSKVSMESNASKAEVQQGNLSAEPRKMKHSASDAAKGASPSSSSSTKPAEGSSLASPLEEEVEGHSGHSNSGSFRNTVTDPASQPGLKLAKMSMTYRGGVVISEENEIVSSESSSVDTVEEGAMAIASDTSSSSLVQDDDPAVKMGRKVLPDVVPESDLVDKSSSSPAILFPREVGVINLGFDGFAETSDFTDVKEDVDSDASKTATIDVSATVNKDVRNEAPEDFAFVDGSKRANLSEEELSPPTSKESHRPPAPLQPSAPLLSTSPDAEGEGPPPQQQYNTFIEKDVMEEAREMVFWWRKKNLIAEEDSEFCLHETECKVKQKPLLLFLHGIGSSADAWNQQLWYFLSCGYEVVAPDLLGHGLSSAPKRPTYYSFAQMLDYVSLVFDLFVPAGRKCIVIGHNYGCALAVALARGRPMSVGLVIMASCGGPSALVPHPKYENALNSTVTRILNPFITCGCLSRELLYTPRGKHYPVVASDDTIVPATPRYVLEYTSKGQVWPEGDMAFHRRITIPALLLYGMKDSDISFVEMCEMEKTIPRAFLELIPGAGHELMTDCPEEVCHAMHRFVRRWRQHL